MLRSEQAAGRTRSAAALPPSPPQSGEAATPGTVFSVLPLSAPCLFLGLPPGLFCSSSAAEGPPSLPKDCVLEASPSILSLPPKPQTITHWQAGFLQTHIGVCVILGSQKAGLWPQSTALQAGFSASASWGEHLDTPAKAKAPRAIRQERHCLGGVGKRGIPLGSLAFLHHFCPIRSLCVFLSDPFLLELVPELALSL